MLNYGRATPDRDPHRARAVRRDRRRVRVARQVIPARLNREGTRRRGGSPAGRLELHSVHRELIRRSASSATRTSRTLPCGGTRNQAWSSGIQRDAIHRRDERSRGGGHPQGPGCNSRAPTVLRHAVVRHVELSPSPVRFVGSDPASDLSIGPRALFLETTHLPRPGVPTHWRGGSGLPTTKYMRSIALFRRRAAASGRRGSLARRLLLVLTAMLLALIGGRGSTSGDLPRHGQRAREVPRGDRRCRSARIDEVRSALGGGRRCGRGLRGDRRRRGGVAFA